MEENNPTGWKIYPIKLYDKKDNEVLGYHGLSVTGKCASIDYSKSEIIEKRYVFKVQLKMVDIYITILNQTVSMRS